MSPDAGTRSEQRLDRSPGYDPILSRVAQAADAVDSDAPGAAGMLEAILAESGSDAAAAARVAHIFARSLLSRLSGDGTSGGNLYAEGPDPGAMLAAFQVLVEATPFIRFGYQSANLAILRALEGESTIHLVDIGIGSGAQWLDFLGLLASRSDDRPSVRLTGIDVPEQGTDAAERLREVGLALRHHADSLGIALEFEPVVGAIQDLDLDRVLSGPAPMAVNAAFALHHVPDGDAVLEPRHGRDAVLSRLREHRPRILALIEPDVEHNALPLGPRVRDSLAHYSTVFDALGTLFPAGMPERKTLEAAFFGREIGNIVVGEGSGRVERHERHDAWRRRLGRAGFRAIDLAPEAAVLADGLGIEPPFSVQDRDGVLLLAWKDEPVVSASAWAPDDA